MIKIEPNPQVLAHRTEVGIPHATQLSQLDTEIAAASVKLKEGFQR